ncbi:Right handed beta helix region [Bradyrhizobium sp. Ghvi]|uniref:right-handed parallel beta-helix repeat-containing protein n=1 Tax=Bradyrhizobium sp. Ghvi TaxID=1855319 RepID=UPI0008EA9B3C|nr:right-handed parallel beta-helix repeat-containing protein [Bradyrhizobium sp. Ghvi]SFP81324.1 Right handed beta helix region [Bradyrhizobium sp. Ghvi]
MFCVKHQLIILGGFLAFFGGSISVRADEFHINVSDRQSDLSLRDAILQARRHRRETPADAIVVDLPASTIRLTAPLELSVADSGTLEAPLIIRGAASGKTELKGSIVVAGLKPSSRRPERWLGHEPELGLFELDVNRFIGKIDLSKRGMDQRGASSNFDLYHEGHRLRIARWPQVGFTREVIAHVDAVDKLVHLKLPDVLFDVLRNEKNVWIGGFWSADWKYETAPLVASETDRDYEISGGSGLSTRGSFRLSILNALGLLSEKDTYVLDAGQKRAIILGEPDASYEIAMLKTLIVIKNAKHIKVENLAMEQTLADVVDISDSDDITFESCFIGHSGSTAISIYGGHSNVIRRCVIRDSSEAAVSVIGGDYQTLTPSGHRIEESIVQDFGLESFSYRPGVQIRGVGNSVINSIVERGPHSAIILEGNDHRITGNEISNVALWTDDVGALYLDRSWTGRGNVIAKNYIHDIGNPSTAQSLVIGIYLDDQFSGVEIEGNVFERCRTPILIGGGKDNFVHDNKFIMDGTYAMAIDGRGLTWQGPNSEAGRALLSSYQRVISSSPEALERYPALRIDERRMWAPTGNRIRANSIAGGTISKVASEAVQYVEQSTDNVVTGPNPDSEYRIQAAVSRERLLSSLLFRSKAN